MVKFETTNTRLWSPYLVRYLFSWKCFLFRSDKKCCRGATHLSPEKSNIQSCFLVIHWKLSVVLLLHPMTLLDLCYSCSLQDILRNMYNNSDVVSHLFWIYWRIEEEQQKKEEQKHKYKQSKWEIEDEKAEVEY